MLRFLMMMSLTWVAVQSFDDYDYDGDHAWWWQDMGEDWDTSDHLSAISPFYQMFKQSQAQMDMYGYAKHVGKINRGTFLDPDIMNPSERWFGENPDFNPWEYYYGNGAFVYQPDYLPVPAYEDTLAQW